MSGPNQENVPNQANVPNQNVGDANVQQPPQPQAGVGVNINQQQPPQAGAAAAPELSETQQLIQLVRQQMTMFNNVQEENKMLREQLSKANQSGNGETHSNTKRPDRPKIDMDTSETAWAEFLDAWDRHKDWYSLSDPSQLRNELRMTCLPSVNRRLIELHGAALLKETTEAGLLELIKDAAVNVVDKQVHRQKFWQITQSEGESIAQFMAKVKSQAELCQFKVPCSSTTCNSSISYAHDMVATQTINGLANTEFQAKILEEVPKFKDLSKEMYERLVSLEATYKSTNNIQSSKAMAANSTPHDDESNAHANKSDYRKAREQRNRNKNASNASKKPCKYCGDKRQCEKRENCPAKDATCNFCKKKGHFEMACLKKKNSSAAATNEGEASKQNSVSFAMATNQDFRQARNPNQTG